MARYSLASELERRIGTRTGSGTLITQGIVDAVRGDEYGNLVVVENNTEQVVNNIGNAIVAALEEMGLAGERFAKAATPVDTGRLRNSMTHAISIGEHAVYIGTNVYYAPYVELGTSGREGVHMLTRAASDHKDYYRKILEKHLKNS